MLPADRVSGFYSIAHSLRVFTIKEAQASFLPLSLWLQEKHCTNTSSPDRMVDGRIFSKKLPRLSF
jgi:hypothetical protein